MKKLMIAAAIVCAAAMSHASMIKWSTGDMYWSSEGSVTSGTKLSSTMKASYSLYNISKAQYDTVMAAIVQDNAYSTDGALSIIAEIAKGTYGDSAKSGQTGKSGNATFNDGLNTYAEGNKYYGLVTFQVTGTDGKEYYIVNAAEVNMGSVDANPINMALNVGGDTTGKTMPTAWATQTVPEPTSGLLLLLGVAGLALRRRRA